MKTFREGGGRGGQPGSRIGGGGGGDSGGAGRGSRQVPSGRTGVGVHAVSAEKVDATVGVARARADLLGIAGASASGKSILRSWR